MNYSMTHKRPHKSRSIYGELFSLYVTKRILSPIDRDEDHTKEGGRNVAVEEEREETTESVAEDPRFVNVAWGRERKVECAEEQIRAGQAHDKGRRGVSAQLAALQQSSHRQQVSCMEHI